MPFKNLGAVSYSPIVVTMAVSVGVCEIFSVKNGVTLKTGLGFVQGHWKLHYLAFHSNYGAILLLVEKGEIFYTCISAPTGSDPVRISRSCLILIKLE